MIQIEQLTKVFFNRKGIHQISFNVEQGQIFGFLGPNGAGKSTTIRHLLGFLKPGSGRASIAGLDCWKEAEKVNRSLGYIPGEISFIDGLTAIDFLKMQAGMRGMKDTTLRDRLTERFQLDIRTPVKRMSKGMKQKLAIINAFMHDPAVLILDEPSSGLDPLMQKTFVELLHEEKARGKTILISSHIFSEVDHTADMIGIIKEGRMIKIEEIDSIKENMLEQCVEVFFEDGEDVSSLLDSRLEVLEYKEGFVKLAVHNNYNELLRAISPFRIKRMEMPKLNLEDTFMKYYNQKEEMKA